MSQDPFFRLHGECDKIKSPGEFSTVLRNGKGFHNGIYWPALWEYVKGETPPLKELHFENCSLSKTTLKGLEFVSCKFIDCRFIDTKFENCEFHGCEFHGCNFYRATMDNCYLDPKAIKGISKVMHPNIALRVFADLKKNAKQVENPNFQSDAEFYYKVYNRYQKRFGLTIKGNQKRLSFKWIYKLFRFVFTFLVDFLWMLISGYGMRSRYVFFSGLSLVCILTFINYRFGALIEGSSNGGDIVSKGVDSLYFSVMTITTLGYGAIAPTNPEGKLLIVSQALVGVIWLTACASVIVKKIVRSS
ncbi:ion channel [Maridesulfovibrio frigidus]|uniref:ion channel n=1 Tax=Maridesulfovibrio frigidus TaxID=340956 RepID=UPI0004E12248|nr:ion channel [Maridesulfovibrio frigidus]